MPSFTEVLTDVGEEQTTRPTPFMKKLGPFTVSVYWYEIPGMESGWRWTVSGRVGSDEPFETMNDAKWDLSANIWELVKPLRLFAQQQRKKDDSRPEDSD